MNAKDVSSKLQTIAPKFHSRETFQPYHDAVGEPSNTDIVQPKEWEDYEENTGATKLFHNVDAGPSSTSASLARQRCHLPLHAQIPIASPTPIPTSSPLHPVPLPLPPTAPAPNLPPPLPPPAVSSSTKRTMRLQPRGIHHFNPAANENWREILQAYLSYTFQDPDILEEALEEPHNGVTRVGNTMRTCMDGNEAMSKLGERVIKLVLGEQYYLLSVPEASASQITNRILDRTSLCTHPTIASCIRAQPSIPRRWSNIKELIKEDLREDSTRIVSRAVKAVIGAVFLDGGMDSAKKVMENLQMGIRMPPGGRG
ncbi:hypothetical protein EYC84_004297 [Monilinia fructicola]|uniref:RNase III domain-containing protein n=1 Tax=Monilinia fructicola TaxID=38448 RepID=A0A5M9K0N0_MONFR|nr:hypothetical protein EYC84_004297 [Monilinia fructicola]